MLCASLSVPELHRVSRCRLADCTADREFHPALKIAVLLSANRLLRKKGVVKRETGKWKKLIKKSQEAFSRYLDSRGMPDPDLIIRPSGELRLSNFLTWQSAYAEFYFTDVLWPDFTPQVLDEALAAFQRRQRRFGGV